MQLDPSTKKRLLGYYREEDKKVDTTKWVDCRWQLYLNRSNIGCFDRSHKMSLKFVKRSTEDLILL